MVLIGFSQFFSSYIYIPPLKIWIFKPLKKKKKSLPFLLGPNKQGTNGMDQTSKLSNDRSITPLGPKPISILIMLTFIKCGSQHFSSTTLSNPTRRPTKKATSIKGQSRHLRHPHASHPHWTDLLSACCHAWPPSWYLEREREREREKEWEHWEVEPPLALSELFRKSKKQRKKKESFISSQTLCPNIQTLSLSIPT